MSLSHDQVILPLDIYLREIKTCPCNDLYLNVYAALFKPKNWKEPKMSNWLIDKQTVVYPYKGILLRNKKGQTTGIHNNMDES